MTLLVRRDKKHHQYLNNILGKNASLESSYEEAIRHIQDNGTQIFANGVRKDPPPQENERIVLEKNTPKGPYSQMSWVNFAWIPDQGRRINQNPTEYMGTNEKMEMIRLS